MDDFSHFALTGHFLRSRRLRTTPESVGLLPGLRRRGPGLRREEVAQLASVSPTWYAYLEQGRRVSASAEVLNSLATALRLDDVERRYLHAVGTGARGPARPPEHPDEYSTRLADELVRRSEVAGQPAYAATATGDVLCWNRHVQQWYGDFPGTDPEHRNMVWWLFTSADARTRIAGWEEVARRAVARIRFSIGVDGAHEGFEAELAQLATRSSEFATWWELHDVSVQAPATRTFVHPEHGRRTFGVLPLRVSVRPPVQIVIHLPDGG